MTSLSAPSMRLYESWAACVADFGDPKQMHGSGNWNLPEELAGDTSQQTCRQLVDTLRWLGTEESAIGQDRVLSDYWWILDEGDRVVGFIAIRHRLDDFLHAVGGHIGYSIAPSHRRRGHATRALNLALDRAAQIGIDKALVTCDDDNLASAATIESAGGVLEDIREFEGTAKRRYWIATG